MTSISFCMHVCRYIISCNLYVLTKLHVIQIIFMYIFDRNAGYYVCVYTQFMYIKIHVTCDPSLKIGSFHRPPHLSQSHIYTY